jgi:hypothetical protein
MKWLRFQLAKPMTTMYMMRLSTSSGASMDRPMAAISFCFCCDCDQRAKRMAKTIAINRAGESKLATSYKEAVMMKCSTRYFAQVK